MISNLFINYLYFRMISSLIKKTNVWSSYYEYQLNFQASAVMIASNLLNTYRASNLIMYIDWLIVCSMLKS